MMYSWKILRNDENRAGYNRTNHCVTEIRKLYFINNNNINTK